MGGVPRRRKAISEPAEPFSTVGGDFAKFLVQKRQITFIKEELKRSKESAGDPTLLVGIGTSGGKWRQI